MRVGILKVQTRNAETECVKNALFHTSTLIINSFLINNAFLEYTYFCILEQAHYFSYRLTININKIPSTTNLKLRKGNATDLIYSLKKIYKSN